MKEKNDRSENLLVMILLNSMKGSSMAEKAETLSLASFTHVEIADYLQTSTPTITQLLYKNRKDKSKRKVKKI